MNDPRFYHLTSDPRFKRVPHHERKVKVDSRFQHMFSDKGFRVQYDVDKRGRKVNQTSGDDLRKYYQLEGDSDKRDSSDEQCSDEEAPSKQDSDEESEGEGLSDSDQVIHDWGDMAEGVEFGEQTSHRLALCNMDWDRVNAHDIYVLVNSFKPSGGCVLSVRVYLSDFGRQRMAEEDIAGPANHVSHGNNLDFEPQRSDTTEGGGYSQEKLRQYQLNRLRYYYAVIECDSVCTAEHIYQECDGLEYEHSGGQLDLRFIPNEMMFDDQGAESEATESTLPLNFTPSQFVSTALQQSKVQLTWDETDPHRLKNTMRKFSKEDAAVMDFSAYLASGSEESEDETKYKALLEDDEGSKGHSEKKEEMVITWEPGLKEGSEQFVTKRKKQGKKLTQWEKYLCERRRKKKEKRLERKSKPSPVDENGFNDEFFQPEVTMATAKSSKKKKKQQKGREESTTESAELELLVMDDDDKKHFHYKDVSDDGFAVDVADPRFEALYQSHLFAPDPAHPQFKNSKGMDAIMREKMRRRQEMTTQPMDLSLEPLVNAVKTKTRAFSKRKKK